MALSVDPKQVQDNGKGAVHGAIQNNLTGFVPTVDRFDCFQDKEDHVAQVG
jgi:hypothetical protein